jgi:acyl dehydratase
VPIDAVKALALPIPPITVEVERGRLRFFARATEQTDAIYVDADAARQAGHRDLPVPPTFFFSLELESTEPLRYLTELGVDLRRILHGEQSFSYHALAYAGDTLTLRPSIVNVFEKKAGALEFIVKRTDVTRDDELIAQTRTVIVVRHPEVQP